MNESFIKIGFNERFIKLRFTDWQLWALFFSLQLLGSFFLQGNQFVNGVLVGFWFTGTLLLGFHHYFEWSLAKIKENQRKNNRRKKYGTRN